MKISKIIFSVAFFIFLAPAFSQSQEAIPVQNHGNTEGQSQISGQDQSKDQNQVASQNRIQKKNFFSKKFSEDFRLQTNVDISPAYNFAKLSNYPMAKMNIDIVEAWFDRIGVSSVIGFTFGLPNGDESLVIPQLFCPGITFSSDIGSGLSDTTGMSIQHTWFVLTENAETAGSETKNVTTIRTYGFSIPVKIRYAFSRRFSAIAEYTFSAHPWIPGSNIQNSSWTVENALSAGLSISFPHNF